MAKTKLGGDPLPQLFGVTFYLTSFHRCLQADNWKIVSAGDDKTLKVWKYLRGRFFNSFCCMNLPLLLQKKKKKQPENLRTY